MKNQLPKKLKRRTSAGVVSFLRENGCNVESGSKHLKASHPNKRGKIIIPNNHSGQIPKGTFNSILKAIRNWGFMLFLLFGLLFPFALIFISM